MDTLFLASFVHAELPDKVQKVCEPGCGCAAALCGLALLRSTIWGLGLEKETLHLASARTNFQLLGLTDRLSVTECDIRNLSSLTNFCGSFEAVLFNAPYYSEKEGRRSQNTLRNIAMRGINPLHDFIQASSNLLMHHGHLFCIYPARKLQSLLANLNFHHFGLTSLLPLLPHRGQSAIRILVHARKAAKENCHLLPGLILHSDNALEKWTDDALSFCPWLSS